LLSPIERQREHADVVAPERIIEPRSQPHRPRAPVAILFCVAARLASFAAPRHAW
jgi:hypothetical protein